MFRAQKVEGNIGLVTDYPAIVAGPDVKQISRSHLVVAAVFHSASGAPGHNHPDVFHLAERRTGRSSNMFRPFPSRLVARATDYHRADLYRLKSSFFKCPHLIWMLEASYQEIIIAR